MAPGTRVAQVRFLVEALAQQALPDGWETWAPDAQRRLLRALMNVWEPEPLPPDVLAVQDALLAAETAERGVVDAADLPVTAAEPRVALWRGDITRLRVDAIVNAANSALLGCRAPGHSCIDNAIHSAAGVQLRVECAEVMAARGRPEPVGTATCTGGHNLPAAHVLHTVGPTVTGPLTAAHEELLAASYRSCLRLAEEWGLASVALCCVSTGVFRFPRDRAAEIAVGTVRAHLTGSRLTKVVFDVYEPADLELYRALLGPDRPAG